jgi:hypothetical protein
MDEGVEFVWSLVAGVLYLLSGAALLGAVATGVDLVLNAQWNGEGNDVRLELAIIWLVCAVSLFGATRLGWYLVDRARQKQQDRR